MMSASSLSRPPATRVVVAEDEDDVRRLLEFNLTSAGFEVVGLDTGGAVAETAAREDAALLVLDRLLPDGDGIAVCAEIRRDERLKDLGILLLTALGSEADRVAGLAAGADDYVVKPFSVREVVARVRILASAVEARRKARHVDVSEARVFRWRDVVVDVLRHRVLAAGVEIELRPFEFVLLLTFLEAPDQVWSREALIAKLWNGEVATSRRTIDVHVRRLRERLGPFGEVVETVHGVGYRLRPE
ncbi:MAG: response regulator transcription factor [Labilithrix sp.]|nr:response regulator transcription factor [Labilithrix sp.]MBX3222317.1 response regulator transcription factor [Labilithrix sp.]